MLGLSSELKIKVGTEKDCLQTVSVEWAAAKVKEMVEKAFEDVRNRAKVPGFRPGKSPMDFIKQNFKDTAYAQAQDVLMKEGVYEAIKQKKIQPVQTPVIQSVQFAPEKPFQFEFQVEVAPTVKPVGYKGIKLTKKVRAAGDEELFKALKRLSESNARLIESTKTELDGTSFGVINYEGFIDGKAIEGAKAENFLLDMSAPQAMKGLTEGLLGAKAAEEREVSVQFPEDSPSKELAGKTANFKVKVTAIKERQLPTLDDEFAKDLGTESLADLKAKVKEAIAREATEKSERDIRSQVVDKLLEENKFTVPKSLVERQSEHLASRQRERLEQQGFPKQDVATLLDGRKAEVNSQAEKEIRLQYVLASIAAAEKIQVTDDEITSKIAAIIKSLNLKEQPQMEKALRERYIDTITSDIREAKVFEWIVANAKIKETTGEAE